MSSPYNPYGGAPGGYPQQGYQQPGYQQPGYGYPPHQGYPPQRGYLQGGPVDFQSAIKLQFENITNFTGRASMSAYWWYILAVAVVDVVLYAFDIAVGSLALTLLVMLLIAVIDLTGLSLAVRRLHDTDKSGWLLLLGLIPFVGGIAVLVLLLLPGTPGQNRFG